MWNVDKLTWGNLIAHTNAESTKQMCVNNPYLHLIVESLQTRETFHVELRKLTVN